MERGGLKQRLLQMFKIPSFRSSCGSGARKSDAVDEPLPLSRRYDWYDDASFHGVDRSLSLPHLPLGRRLSKCRDETAVGSSHRSVDFRCRGKKMKEKPDLGPGDGVDRMCPPRAALSPSYYHFKQMREELERDARRISSRKKKGKEDERNRIRNKKLLNNSYGFTSCSSEDSFSSSEEEGGNREADAADILFGSRSFSSDSSELYYLSHRCRSKNKTKTKKKSSQRLRNPKREDRHKKGPDVAGGFRPLVSTSFLPADRVNQREGLAVEKRSKDPYADFRSSMVEMIVEKQIFGAMDLEGLLRSYLTLNDPRHHPIIIQVFSEIWEALFGN